MLVDKRFCKSCIEECVVGKKMMKCPTCINDGFTIRDMMEMWQKK